jgi:ADP-heptose:LPS heptosyltransferase
MIGPRNQTSELAHSTPKRIAACNPDGLGDFMLREPLYNALLAEGHALMLLVRTNVAWLARHLFPNVALVEIRFDPCAQEILDHRVPAWPELPEAVRAWQPELLLLPGYQWTSLDRALVSALPGMPLVSIGDAAADKNLLDSREHHRVPVRQNDHEIEKNFALARFLTRCDLPKRRPRLAVISRQREAALARLADLGFAPGTFWLGTLGAATLRYELGNWQEDNWVKLLQHGIRVHGLTFVLAGSAAERTAHDRIREALGPDSASVGVFSDLSEDEFLGLIALAGGYLGRDTGTAHVAAALDRKVLTVLARASNLRFVPAAVEGRTFTMAVPCRNCAWLCPHPESWCVKAIPPSLLIRALDDLILGVDTSFRLVELRPDAGLSTRLDESGRQLLAALKQVFADLAKPGAERVTSPHDPFPSSASMASAPPDSTNHLNPVEREASSKFIKYLSALAAEAGPGDVPEPVSSDGPAAAAAQLMQALLKNHRVLLQTAEERLDYIRITEKGIITLKAEHETLKAKCDQLKMDRDRLRDKIAALSQKLDEFRQEKRLRLSRPRGLKGIFRRVHRWMRGPS